MIFLFIALIFAVMGTMDTHLPLQLLNNDTESSDGRRRKFRGFAECRLYSAHGNNKIYLVLDRVCRHVPNRQTFDNLFKNWKGIIKVSPSYMNRCRKGRAIRSGAFLMSARYENPVYLVDHVARHIKNRYTFETCNFDWHKIHSVPPSVVRNSRKGSKISV